MLDSKIKENEIYVKDIESLKSALTEALKMKDVITSLNEQIDQNNKLLTSFKNELL